MNSLKLVRTAVLVTLMPIFLLPARGSADDAVWRDVAMATALSRAAGEPIYYRPLQADLALLKSQLGAAPREFTSSQGTVLTLPMPDGTLQRFDVVESPILAPGLAERYPEIHTYRALGIDDPRITGRLDITPQGFHAMLSSPSGAVFIDPERGSDYYRSYRKRDYANAVPRSASERAVCLVDGAASDGESGAAGARTVLARTGDQLRTYDLAVAATAEYTAVFGGTTAAAYDAIVTAINRVNEIYERDLAIHLQLVSDESVVYTDAATDPYINNSATDILSHSQGDLDTKIGSANYDIGHVFSTGSGGLAQLGVVCDNSNKARGTTGLSNPTGDAFYIDYVAHEIGHQFGANHSFNGTTFNCVDPNRHGATAYEPGSGSTVMAYAGICGSENLQNNSDATFHAGSIAEILTYVAGVSCQSSNPTGNTYPIVNAGSNYTIPSQTPFVLTGSATDANGDSLTYQWDEMDAGTQTDSSTFGTDLGDNALFRSFLPRSNAYRHFPRLINQLAGRQDPAEVLPTTTRTLNFRLTARDGNSGVDEDNMVVTVAGGAGPFEITSLSPAQSTYSSFDAVTVNWDVAGTGGFPVNCTNVDIDLLTFNSGKTSYCATTLASNTANDGSQQIAIPDQATSYARFRVMCRGNIFYDITDSDVTINSSTAATTNCTNVDWTGGVSSGSAGSGGSTGGGGGGGSVALWLLALLGAVSILRVGINYRRSV